MNKVELEYVASGNNYTRICYAEAAVGEVNRFYREAYRRLNDPAEGHGHKFSLLYNAWTEKKIGETIDKHFASDLNAVYADSGGLQIITAGKSITDKEKTAVYKNQAKYSDFGMCFDEIPLSFIDGVTKSGRNDTETRWFDKDKVIPCAEQTGRNILDQINVYLDEKSDTKPVIILQGNCYDSFMMWFDALIKQIPQDKHKYIGAIAMSGASIGGGLLEDVERAFIFSQLQFETNHLHLLGLGSVKRIIPFAIMSQSGLLGDIRLSYDSTTHTSAPHMGRYYMEGGAFEMTKHFDYRWEQIFQDTQRNFPIDIEIKEFFKALTVSARKHTNIDHSLLSVAAFTYSSILNFMRDLHSTWMDKDLKKKVDRSLQLLYTVKTKSEFDSWMTEVGRHVKTKRISSDKPVNLDGFFA